MTSDTSQILRGIFLTSQDPQRTASFYQNLALLKLVQVGHGEGAYWKSDEGGVQFAIHNATKFSAYSDPPLPGSNLTHLYFNIIDQQQFLERLQAANLAPYDTDDVVVTVMDPDGRKVMFGTA